MGDSDIYRGEMTQHTPLNSALCKIWYRLWQITGFGASGAGGITVAPAKGTYVTAHVANGASLPGGIPQSAKRWAVNFVGTGTANTLGTNTSVTGGQSFSDNGAPVSALAVACDNSTVADIIYSTT